MKYKQLKLMISALIFLVGLWMNIYFSTNLHFLLSRKMDVLSFIPMKSCFESMAASGQHLSLFLYLQGFVLLCSIYFYLANMKPYQSDLAVITPEISTPVRAGQMQFGSARWLTEEEKNKSFKCIKLKKNEFKVFMERMKLNEEKEEKTKQQEVFKTQKEPEQAQPFNKKSGVRTLSKKNSKEYSVPQLEGGGIVIGFLKDGDMEKIFYIDEDTHSLCIGATRSGKTRSVVLQSVGVLGLSGESLIISDPKGEIFTYTYPYLVELGYEVICIDFKNPLKSDRYNFLQPVIDAVNENNISKAVDATWDLTAALVPENSHNEKIWTNGEASIIASAIMAVVYDNRKGKDKKYQNMSNVYFFISEMCKVVDGSMPIIKYMKNMPANHPAKALLAISEVAPSKTRGSFYTSALTTLRLFTNPLIHSMSETSDFDVRRMGTDKQALFIVLPDEKTTYYSLASLFVNQCYMQLVKNADERGGRLKRRVNFVLEEFGNFVKIPDFANKLTVGGGRGIRFNLFLQSFMQLDEKYGKETAGTIKSNCETWIYLQADDLGTLDEMSKKLGNYTVSTYSLSSSHGKYSNPSSSHSVNLTHRALLTVDEIRRINRPFTLITSRNHPAMMQLPDLSKWFFNGLFGLGDKEHNRKVREMREMTRKKRKSVNSIDTWNIWEYYTQEEKPNFVYKRNMKGGEQSED
ncbi:MAG: conjugal transfer protein TraG [Firmicutes bacterium HGW-Firmicutes-5]|nr:MAG: conjugal transfer protein TraG [Firmicutes bacterium HGW-Firmicutes-5]